MIKKCIDVIIVNWNSGTQLAEAYKSIVQFHNNLVSSVIIVDNNSTDDSLAQVELLGASSFILQIIRNPENLGFAAGCNQGAVLGNSKYFLFLNPDTRLFADTLAKSIVFMEQPQQSSIGICGIRLIDEEGNTSTSAARFPTLRVMAGENLGLSKIFPSYFPAHLLSSVDLRENSFVDQVIGAFFLIRKNVFRLCSGFDEIFFVYYEEVDLSIRAKLLGYSSYFLSDVIAYHKGGGCSEQVKADRLFYSLRSRILYAKKHYSSMEFVAIILLTGVEMPLRLGQALYRASWSDVINTLAAYIRLTASFAWRN